MSKRIAACVRLRWSPDTENLTVAGGYVRYLRDGAVAFVVRILR